MHGNQLPHPSTGGNCQANKENPPNAQKYKKISTQAQTIAMALHTQA
jgi:hypothetical protein